MTWGEGSTTTANNGDGQQQQDLPVHRAEHPWKPAFMVVKPFTQEEEVYRRMLGILNRVTEQSLPVLLSQARQLPLSNSNLRQIIISLVIHKVQDEPIFSAVYVQLLIQMTAVASTLTKELISACEAHARQQHISLLNYEQLLQGAPPDGLVFEEKMVREQTVAHLKFMCQVFSTGVMRSSVLLSLLEYLKQDESWRSLECFCWLMAYSSPGLGVQHPEVVNRYCQELRDMKQNNRRNLSFRLKFLVEETLSRVSNGLEAREAGMRTIQ